MEKPQQYIYKIIIIVATITPLVLAIIQAAPAFDWAAASLHIIDLSPVLVFCPFPDPGTNWRVNSSFNLTFEWDG